MDAITNSREVIESLNMAAQRIGAHQHRMLYRMGQLVKDTGVKYAPKGPTQAEFERQSKATPNQWKAAKARRTPRATTRRAPGSLMQSIAFKATRDQAEIFVAANSAAGKYAWKIHEEKGKTWFKRGPGTVAKGPQADDKFLQRALDDNRASLERIAEDQMNKAVEEANRA